jgi:hypothetical protein
LSNNPIDLELRCTTPSVGVGDTIDVGIYAVGQDEPFCLLCCLLEWSESKLRLTGAQHGGSFPPDGSSTGEGWMFQGFPPDVGSDQVNNLHDAGVADYQAWADMSGFPVATPGGLLIDTLHFEALAAGAAEIEIPCTLGNHAVSAVYDEEYGGWSLLRGRRGCSIEIIEYTPATLADLAGLLSAYGKEHHYYDLDGDGVVGLADLSVMLSRIRAATDG